MYILQIMKKARPSFITKTFLQLALLMTVLTLLLGVSISVYLYKTVETETIDYNKSLQKFATDSSSKTINRLISLAKEASYDSNLINILYAYKNTVQPFPEQQIAKYLSSKVNNNIWVTSPESNLITLYLLYGEKDSFIPVSPQYADSTILSQPSLMEKLDKTGPTILPLYEHPLTHGVQQFTFQIANPIIDPVNGDMYGYIILDVSEKVLYDSYKDVQSPTKGFAITDSNGTILSAKDKTTIGHTYLPADEAELGKRASGFLKSQKEAAMIFYQQIGGTQWYLVQKADIKVLLASLTTMQIFIIGLFFVSITIILFILAQFRLRLAKPIIDMNTMLDTVATGDLSVRSEIATDDEFGKMAQSFNTMVEEIENLLLAIKDTEKAKRLAELDFLRAQINPHFIYNTLSSIRFSIEMQQGEKAAEMIFHFSRLLRSTLSRSHQFIPLKEEITIIEYYAELQKYRYPDGFVIHYDLAPDTFDCEVPSFILQPLVENAIFHNEGLPRMNTILITSSIVDNRLNITVEDSGFGLKTNNPSELLSKPGSLNHVGLHNVHERIQLNYGMEYGLTITSEKDMGTTIVVSLPSRIYSQEGGADDQHPGG